MGERKGQNKYYPPDYDPRAGGLNKWQGVHALRERARKIGQGIIIIRFEMPYNIWCEGCKNHIGMGVRYNAEKKKIGMYYTTPVYEFKMNCHLCDNHFVIKTDPGNLDYIILSGARRQENRWDPTKNEQVVPETKEIQKRMFDDPMFKLEHQSNDKTSSDDAKPRLARLFSRNESTWSDVYTANQKLREQFRNKSLELKQTAVKDGEILSKYSLDIPLVPEREEDKRIATLLSMKLKPSVDIVAKTELSRKRIISSSSLPSSFTLDKEKKVMRILNSASLKGMNIIKKVERNHNNVDAKSSGSVNQQYNNKSFIGHNDEECTVEKTNSTSETELEAHTNNVNYPNESVISTEIIKNVNGDEMDIKQEYSLNNSPTFERKKAKANLSLVGDYGSSSSSSENE